MLSAKLGGDTLCGGIPADALADFAVVSANKISNGAVKFADFEYALKSSRRLKIIADGETVFETELGRDENIVARGQSYTETLSAEFDFATFERFARKKRIAIVLGKTTLPLSEKQIAALRQMSELTEQQGKAEIFR